jgi:hypothetical protein
MSEYLRQSSDQLAKLIENVAQRPVDSTGPAFAHRAALLATFEGQRSFTVRIENAESVLRSHGMPEEDIEHALMYATATALIKASADLSRDYGKSFLTGVREVAEDLLIDIDTARSARIGKA